MITFIVLLDYLMVLIATELYNEHVSEVCGHINVPVSYSVLGLLMLLCNLPHTSKDINGMCDGGSHHPLKPLIPLKGERPYSITVNS